MNATLLRSAKQEAGPTVALVPGNRLFVLSRDHESFISFESLIVLVDSEFVVTTRSRRVVAQSLTTTPTFRILVIQVLEE